MGLLYEDQYAEKLAGTTLTIQPGDNESIRIKKIGFSGFSSDAYATLITDRTKVGYLYPYYGGTAMFPVPIQDSAAINPYENRYLDGIDLTYPVANGEIFTITTSASGNIYVIYDIYDAADIKNTDPNGSHATVVTFYQYLTNGSALTTATSEVFSSLATNLNPSDFPAFPVRPVGAGQEFDIHAVGIQALSRGNGSANQGYTKHLRMKYNREVLFDEAGLGWLCLGNTAYTTNAYTYGTTVNTVPYAQLNVSYLKRFTTPLTFKQGDELLLEVGHQAGAAGTIEANKIIAWLLMTQRRG